MLSYQSQKGGQIEELHIVIIPQPTDNGEDIVLVQRNGSTIPVDDNESSEIAI